MCKGLVHGRTKANVYGDLVIENPKSLGFCPENYGNPPNYSKQNLTKVKSYLENITLESNLEGWSECRGNQRPGYGRNLGQTDGGG